MTDEALPIDDGPSGDGTRRRSLAARLLGDERVRYLLVGGFNTAFGYAVFVIVQFFFGQWIGYFASLYSAHLIASIVAFTLHRRVVFRVSGNVIIDFLRFQSVYIVALAINTVMLPLLVEVFHWNVYLAQASIVFVTVVVTFAGHKYFSFRRPAALPEEGTPQGSPQGETSN